MYDLVWKKWLADVMKIRPSGNRYLDSPRGMEIGRLALDFERENFSWRRSDVDTFWLDVMLCTKYKLSDEDCLFVFRKQPGIDNYKMHAEERKAYREMMRGIEKLKKCNKKSPWRGDE